MKKNNLLQGMGFLCAVVINFCGYSVTAQSSNDRPVLNVGDRCPDFLLKNVRYGTQSTLSRKNLEGQFYILDFWTVNCTGCVNSFPKINDLQKKFKGKMNFIMIGRDELGRGGLKKVAGVYEKFQSKYDLQMMSAYDTASFNTFDVPAVSHLIWVDNKSIIRAITSSYHLDSVNIEEFLKGRPISLKNLTSDNQFQEDSIYTFEKPLLVNGNGGNDSAYLYRSILAKWNPASGTDLPFSTGFTGKFQGTGLNLTHLYRYAYFGKPFFNYAINGDTLYGKASDQLVLRVKDSSLFQYHRETGKNYFSCAIEFIGKRASDKELMEQLQDLLHRYFGFTARVKNMETPCWKLIASVEAKKRLKTKQTGPPKPLEPSAFTSYGPTGFSFENRPIDYIIRCIWSYNQKEMPFIDETGIDFGVDFGMEAVMTDLEDVRAALQKQGLDLVRGTKLMPTIVISDE